MKKIISAIAALLSVVCINAQSIYDVDGIYYRIMTSPQDDCKMIAAVWTMNDLEHYQGDIVIPPTVTVNDTPYSVEVIGDQAFKNCYLITSVSIPASVKEIPAGVFYGCDNLSTITVDPANTVYDSREDCNAVIDKMDNKLIAGCKNSIIPSSVDTIGMMAFAGCKGLTSLTIPSNVISIKNWAFLDCTGLLTLSVPNTLGDLAIGSFMGCNNIETLDWNTELFSPSYVSRYALASLKTVVISSDVTAIDSKAFEGCNDIDSIYWDYTGNANLSELFAGSADNVRGITIGPNVTSIATGSFKGFHNLQSLTVEPGNTVFDSRENCNGIVVTATNTLLIGCKTTTVPEGITRLEDNLFSWCYGPGTLVLPSTLREIGESALNGCSDLASLTIPENVQKIGTGYTDLPKLTSISVDSRNPYYNSNGNCNAIIETATGMLILGCRNTVIPSGTTGLADYAFANQSQLEFLLIPASVNNIGSYAFMNCSLLKSLIIPEGVDTIRDKTFSGCSSLEYLSVPSTVKGFGTEVFSGCDNLTSAGPQGGGYRYEFNWDTIPARAFDKLTKLQTVYIPKTVKAIGSIGIFDDCRSLNSIAVSLKDTKWAIKSQATDGQQQITEVPLDYRLHVNTPLRTLTLLDDTITDLSKVLTRYIRNLVISEYVKEIKSDAFSFDPLLMRDVPHYVNLTDPWYIVDHDKLFSDSAYTAYYDSLDNAYMDDLHVLHIESGIESVIADEANTEYTSINGVLFSKDASTLVAYPTIREGEYRIPGSTVNIMEYAFKLKQGLTGITIPGSVRQISERAFEECKSLRDVIIDGTPEIGEYAFLGCNNINSVSVISPEPGIMVIPDSARTILAGNSSSIHGDNNIIVSSKFNQELGREVSLVSHKYSVLNYSFEFEAGPVPSGTYKVSIGILPTPDNKQTQFHPAIYGYTDDGQKVTLFDPEKELNRPPFKISMLYTNDRNSVLNNRYESILLNNSLVIPEGINRIKVVIANEARDKDEQSAMFMLDRVFFEPLDQTVSEKGFGPFDENVFNNATLYVPQGTVDAYRNADGWKLFTNIQEVTKVYPAQEIEVTITDAGYATFYYSDADYVLPTGLKAMVVSDIAADGKLVYTTIAQGGSGTIPAGTAVVLATDDNRGGVFKLEIASRNSTYRDNNLLMGTDVATTTYGPGSCYFYKLSLGPSDTGLDSVPGWYWASANGESFMIDAHKAWLAIPKSAASQTRAFNMEGYPTQVTDLSPDFESILIHDLNGRVMSDPSENQILIINGKKVYLAK